MANIKFSAFTQKVALGDVDFLVGYTGADNVRVAPSVLSSVYLPLAGGIMTGTLNLSDNVKAIWGNGSDLQIYHDTSNSYIKEQGTGRLILSTNYLEVQNAAGTEAIIEGIENGAVNLYYDSVKTFETTATGVKIVSLGTGSAPTWDAAKGDGIIFNMYNDGSPYLRHASIVANSGDTSAAQLEFYTTPASGSGTLALTLDASQDATFTGDITMTRAAAGDEVLTINTTTGGDPTIILNSAAANRSGLLRFYDNGINSGTIQYNHLGDFMDFYTGGTGATHLELSLNETTGATFRSNVIIPDGSLFKGTTFSSSNISFAADTTVSANDDIIFNTNGSTTALTLDASQNATFAGSITTANTEKIYVGGATGMYIYTDAGTANYILNKTDDLIILNQANDKDIIFKADDGSGGDETYFYLDGGEVSANPHTVFPDNSRLSFGNLASGDFNIWYETGVTALYNNTGNLQIANTADDADIRFYSDNGSGGITEYLRLDGGTEQNVVSKNMRFEDNIQCLFGAGSDLRIKHDGSDSYIQDTGTGNLKVCAANWHLMNAAATEYMATGTPDGPVILYYDNVNKFSTTATGTVTYGQMDISALNTAPASAGAAGTLGEIRYTADYIYVCTATNTWKRTAISTW